MKTVILHTTSEDQPYLGMLKAILQGRGKFYLDNTVPDTGMEYVLKAKQKSPGTAIASTSQNLLQKILPYAKNPKIDNYAGSIVNYKDTEFLFLDPLEQLISKPTGKFIFNRYMDKLLAPEGFISEPPFTWELFDPGTLQLEWFQDCDLIAIDIETFPGDEDKSIICVGYCGAKLIDNQLALKSLVIPVDSMFNLAIVRKLNNFPAPKVFQNGKYDIAYFLRFNAPVKNYLFDTLNLFHSWLSELPKDLGFINSFMIRNYIFHKNDHKGGDRRELYEYNARDCYTTLLSCLGILQEMPGYGLQNYLLEFPLVFPCILSEHTGLKWDSFEATKQAEKVAFEFETGRKKLQVMTACPNFNPASSQQTTRLFAALGSKDILHSTPKDRDKVANRHPLNARILGDITDFRETAKLKSAIFKDNVVWKGRVFYALNPHGTDTGRLASKESQFWCGLQIQNIPGGEVKNCFVADKGFYLGEADSAQAESKGTAYLSGDIHLIAAVDDETKYFHGTNASKFFGIPYEELTLSQEIDGEWVHEKLNKTIINIAKRVNHGANYNMGERVLLETMGIKFVLQAKKLLKLPAGMSPLEICSTLLGIFNSTYPILKDDWYKKCIADVQAGFLIGPTGWTRKCFGDASKSKRDLNRYVAHPPQSLNAMMLNKAYLRVFQEVYLPNPNDFKLHCQIHDSILFSYRQSREDLAWKVKECMYLPTAVKDTFGIIRTMIVNVDLKGGGTKWGELHGLRKKKE